MIQTDNSQRATTHLANPGGVAGYLGEPSQAAARGRPLAVAAEVGRDRRPGALPRRRHPRAAPCWPRRRGG